MQQELFDPVSLAFGEQQVPIPDANIFASLDAFNAIKAARTLTQKSKEEQASQADLLNKILTGEAAREAEARRNALGEQLAARIEELGKPLELSKEAPDIFDYLGGIAAGAISGDYGAAIAAVEASRKQREDEKNRQAVLDYESRQKALAYEMQTLTGDIEEAGRDYWRSLEMAAQQNRLAEQSAFEREKFEYGKARDIIEDELKRLQLDANEQAKLRAEIDNLIKVGAGDAAYETAIGAKFSEAAALAVKQIADETFGLKLRAEARNAANAIAKDYSGISGKLERIWQAGEKISPEMLQSLKHTINAQVQFIAGNRALTEEQAESIRSALMNELASYGSQPIGRWARWEMDREDDERRWQAGMALARERLDQSWSMHLNNLDVAKGHLDARMADMAINQVTSSTQYQDNLDYLRKLNSEILDIRSRLPYAESDEQRAAMQSLLNDLNERGKRFIKMNEDALKSARESIPQGGAGTASTTTLTDGTSYRIINPNPPGGAENTRMSRGGQIASSQGRGGIPSFEGQSRFTVKDNSGRTGTISPEIKWMGDVLPDMFGVQLYGRGYRSPEHNRAVGGASASRHLSGEALDLGTKDKAKGDAIVMWAKQNGQALGLRQIIWRDENWRWDGSKWVKGKPVSGHYDHVHLGR